MNAVLATDIVAKTTLPSGNVSAMDGFAVRFEDVKNAGTTLRVIAESTAGEPSAVSIKSGEAVKISTGAILPDGADHVLIREHSLWNPKTQMVGVEEAQKRRRHVRMSGLDFSAGETILDRGTKIGPAELGLIAAANHSFVPVRMPLKVAIITNGNELHWPGADLKRGDLVNSNYFTIAGLCRLWGAEPIKCEIADDNEESILRSLSSLEEVDVVVTIGGASVGDHDFMKSALERFGTQRLFDRVALRPGKPTWFGLMGNTPVLGLPGNPVAAYVGAHLLLAPLIGVFDSLPLKVGYSRVSLDVNTNRDSLIRAKAEFERGRLLVEPLDQQDTSLTRSLVLANCLLYREPSAAAVKSGSRVSILWTSNAAF